MDLRESLARAVEQLLERPGLRDRPEIIDRTEALQAKLDACRYHVERLKALRAEGGEWVLICSSFEIEALLMQLRAAVDVSLQLVNVIAELWLPEDEVTIAAVVTSRRTPLRVQQVLAEYTRRNDLWRFIYELRNQIAHQRVITQVTPLMMHSKWVASELISEVYIITAPEISKPAIAFLEECTQFAERLAIRLVRALLA